MLECAGAEPVDSAPEWSGLAAPDSHTSFLVVGDDLVLVLIERGGRLVAKTCVPRGSISPWERGRRSRRTRRSGRGDGDGSRGRRPRPYRRERSFSLLHDLRFRRIRTYVLVMYSFGLSCGQCHSSYTIQVPSANPVGQQCVVCGSMEMVEVANHGIQHAWNAVVMAEEDEEFNQVIERIRDVFGPGVEELEPAEPAAAAA